MNLSWLTSARAKSIATVLPAVGSLVAVIIAAFKPTGVDSSARAYEIVRAELVSQRAEMLEVRRGLIELETWFKVWREYQDMRTQRLRELSARAVSSPTTNRSAAGAPGRIEDVIELEESAPPPPKLPKISESASAKPPLPPAKAIF